MCCVCCVCLCVFEVSAGFFSFCMGCVRWILFCSQACQNSCECAVVPLGGEDGDHCEAPLLLLHLLPFSSFSTSLTFPTAPQILCLDNGTSVWSGAHWA